MLRVVLVDWGGVDVLIVVGNQSKEAVVLSKLVPYLRSLG